MPNTLPAIYLGIFQDHFDWSAIFTFCGFCFPPHCTCKRDYVSDRTRDSMSAGSTVRWSFHPNGLWAKCLSGRAAAAQPVHGVRQEAALHRGFPVQWRGHEPRAHGRHSHPEGPHHAWYVPSRTLGLGHAALAAARGAHPPYVVHACAHVAPCSPPAPRSHARLPPSNASDAPPPCAGRCPAAAASTAPGGAGGRTA